MEQHSEVTFAELFSARFQMRRGDLAPVDTTSMAEARRRDDELVQVRLSKGVRIPRLQRDYAQGRQDGSVGRVTRVRTEFLAALHEALTGGSHCSLSFVYGQFDTPVEQAGVFEASLLPLDGQQRLTTLYLLHWYASRRDERAADAEYLSGFTYSTRYSSEEFCSFLCSLKTLSPNPSESAFLQGQSMLAPTGAVATRSGSLVAFLANKAAFVDSWRSDPTVAGMLVMLDAIHARFGGVPELWDALTGPRRPLRFHFLPLAAVGVEPDQIFIKMNSRGLELTDFEYFKADLLGMLEANGWTDEQVTELGSRIDRDWEGTFWALARHSGLDESDLDPLMMRYANFIIDMLGIQTRRFRKGGDNAPINPRSHLYDPDRVRAVFVPGGKWDARIVMRFLAAFDCWTSKSADGASAVVEFFDDRFVEDVQSGDLVDLKIRLFGRAGPRLMVACVSGKALASSDRALLFSLVSSLSCDDETQAPYVWNGAFSARFRGIRNIAEKMDGSVETLYLWLNAFPKVLGGAAVSSTFGLADVPRPIPEHVVAEENFKLSLASSEDERLGALYWIEEHDWLRGRANVLCPDVARAPAVDGASEFLLDRAARLGDALVRMAAGVSACDAELRLALLLSVDDGTYAVKTRFRQEFWGAGSGHPDARWRELFRRPTGHDHPGNSAALLALLEHVASAPEGPLAPWLRRFVEERLKQHGSAQPERFDLRYYLLTYPDTMLNFPGWPNDPQTGYRTCSGIVLARSYGNRLAYLVNTAGNWFWDPYLLTVLARVDPDSALVPERRWRGSDMTARRVVLGDFGVRCRDQGFLVDAPAESPLQLDGLVALDEVRDREVPEGRVQYLWPVRQADGLDAEDRVARGEALFAWLAQAV